VSEENDQTWDDEYDEWMVYRIDEDSVDGYVIARKPSEALAVYEEQCAPGLGGPNFEILEIRLVRPNEEIKFRWDDLVQGGPRVEVDDSYVKATAATWANIQDGPPTMLCYSEW